MKRGANRLRSIQPRQMLGGLSAFAVIALAFVVVLLVSGAGIFRGTQPTVALALAPYDGEARANLAARLAVNKSSDEAATAARSLALDGIRRTPLAPVGLRALALTYDSRRNGDRDRAASIMRQGQRVSRRDLLTQVWLIEYHLGRNDPAAVMRQVDLALRTSSSGRDTLFPVIATISTNPTIARALASRMRDRPPWTRAFMLYLVDSGPAPTWTVYFALNSLNPTVPEDMEIIKALLVRLGYLNELDQAWRLYSGFKLIPPGQEAGSLVEGGFEGTRGLAPFAWSLVDESDLWAARQPSPGGEDGQVLSVSADSGRSGVVARQLTRLPPGAYRIRARVGAIPRESFGRPVIGLECAGRKSQRVLGTLKPGETGEGARALEGRVAVPSDCRFQWLTITIGDNGLPDDEAPWIDDIQLQSGTQ